MAIIAFLAFGAVAVTLWIRYFRTKPRAKYMRTLLVGTTFMSLGFICRFSRRNGINAWSWLFETLVGNYISTERTGHVDGILDIIVHPALTMCLPCA